MALTVQDPGLLLTRESAGSVTAGSLILAGSQRSEGGFTIYRILFKVLSQNPEGLPVYLECELWKRFRDFQQLSRQLETCHAHSHAHSSALPRLVKTRYFDRFKEVVVEERRQSAEALLQFATSSPHLSDSAPLRAFLAGAQIVRIVPATPPPSYPSLPQPPSSHPPEHHTPIITENGDIATNQNHAPHTTPDQQNISTNPSDLTVPPQNPPGNPPHSNTPSPSHTNSGRPSPNHLRGSVEFPPGGSPVPPGTNMSTDYSSTESIDEACTEHAQRLLKIVTPPELGEESEGEGGEVGVSEWGLEHTLKLRGDAEEEEGGEEWGLEHTLKLRGDAEEEEGGEELDTLTPADCEKARQKTSKEEETKSSEPQPTTLPTTSSFHTPEKSDTDTGRGTPPPPDSPFSLSCLGLPTTPLTPTAASLQPRLEGPMSWWAEALAETENMEDIDALVDQLEGAAGSSSAATKREEKKKNEEEEEEGGEGAVVKSQESEMTLTGNKAEDSGSADENVSPIPAGEGEDESKSVSVPGVPKQSGANSAEGRGVSSASAVNTNPASHHSSIVMATKTTPLPSRSPSPSATSPAPSEEVAYIAQAGRLIRQALQYEQEREFEEAFDLFKAAVDVLLNGVQTEQSKRRRELVSQKTEEYLRYAEALHQTHLSSQATPLPAMTPHLLKDFKPIGLIGKVILVQSRHNQQTYVFKVLHKSLIAVPRGRPKTTVNRSPTQCPHMVQLLHHYETANHRVYLLLEHARGGRMVDLVAARRQQWEILRAAAINPPTSSSLLLQDTLSPEKGEEEEEEEEDMEKMLSELTLISPPSNTPLLEDSLTGGEGEGGSASSSLDSLAAMRRRLLETEDGDESVTPPTATPTSDDTAAATSGQKKGATAAINVEPPTPTSTSGQEPSLVSRGIPSEDGLDRLTTNDSLKSCNDDDMLPSMTSGSHGDGGGEGKGAASARGKSPCFSPVSLQNSPGNSSSVDDWVQRLEGSVKQWALQIITSLEHLHRHGIICKDLNPDNLLLDMSGNSLLTYFGKWDFVEQGEKAELASRLYVAPELKGLEEATPAADWWSLGAILYEVLTGQTLLSCHPGGVDSHIPLRIPCPLSPEASSLLRQLLQVNPQERLGGGVDGAEELRSHPFFTSTPL